jgi:hypothetical protein
VGRPGLSGRRPCGGQSSSMVVFSMLRADRGRLVGDGTILILEAGRGCGRALAGKLGGDYDCIHPSWTDLHQLPAW